MPKVFSTYGFMMARKKPFQLVLITPTAPDVSSFGVRSLSAFLKREGFLPRCVFLPGSIGRLREGGRYTYRYDPRILKEVLDLCRGADLVGISFFTNYFDRALQLTESVKSNLGIPVIWGGIHASVKPRECLEYADMVCVGEGELSLLELLRRREAGDTGEDIEGIWFVTDRVTRENPLRPLVEDLDRLPFFDYSNQDHYVLSPPHQRMEPLTDQILEQAFTLLPSMDGRMVRIYKTMVMRGCPHQCAYCNVPTLKRIYRGSSTPFVRSRSVDHAIHELVYIKNRFPFVKGIQLFDDTFFARPQEFIEAFSERYGRDVGLPLYCQASPETLSRAKLEALLDCGLVFVEMGIQSGSLETQDLYNRRSGNEKILEASGLLERYRHRLLPPDYHVILNNPWETEEDVMESVRLLHKIPRPYGLAISSLVLYPGTELYEKAMREGRIRDEVKDVFQRPFYIPPRKYAEFLVYLFTLPGMPKWIMTFLLKDSVAGFLSNTLPCHVWRVGYAVGEALRLVLKGFQSIRARDWQRLGGFLSRLRSQDPTVSGRKK